MMLLFVIAVSLSMDAFSLSLAYGTLALKKKDCLLLSLIVGIYHFFMPLLGMKLGSLLFSYINIDFDFVGCVILSIIGIGMIHDAFSEEEKIKKMQIGELLFFGLAVSIDSFSVGIGFKAITNDFLLGSSIFSVTSSLFTYFGLLLGNKISHMIGKYATFAGGIVLLSIGIFSFLF